MPFEIFRIVQLLYASNRHEVKLLTPDARSKLGSTSNSTACSDDAACYDFTTT